MAASSVYDAHGEALQPPATCVASVLYSDKWRAFTAPSGSVCESLGGIYIVASLVYRLWEE